MELLLPEKYMVAQTGLRHSRIMYQYIQGKKKKNLMAQGNTNGFHKGGKLNSLGSLYSYR